MGRKFLILIATGVLTLSLAGTAILAPARTLALSGSEFNAGNIIDDSLFYDGSAMSTDQIQAFLNAKVPICDTNGVQMHWSGVTRAQRGAAYGNPAPFICLKDFRQDTLFKAGESGLCDAMPAKSNQSAAQIINDVGRACNISQKVLIVMLQKEQSLITDDWPWTTQYTKAMGYYCPDDPNNPGWCHPDYAGFFNQVYNAALQFQRYKASPNNWNHIPGAYNNILYQANAPHCGARTTFIENYATAGLYNYTPYTPNQAALDNLYGTGDGCSAYGNRNFWRLYNDWFGTTRGSYLLRSVENATVYLVADEMKYPIASMDVLGALYPLGPVKFVSQSYLNEKTTGQLAGRLIRAQNGTIYFYDAGIKLAFTSCAMLEHYGFGAECDVNYMNLSDQMLMKLSSGPNMTRVFGTTSGKQFYIENGKKREIFDDTAKQQAGITAGANTLNESAIGYLSYGVPIVRNNTVIQSRNNGSFYILDQGKVHPLAKELHSETVISTLLPKKPLDQKSIEQIAAGSALTGLIRNNANTQHYAVDKSGKANLEVPEEWGDNFTPHSDSFIAALPNSTQQINNYMVKSPSNATVYYVTQGTKKPIADWGDFLRMKPSPQVVNTLSSATLDSLSTGSRLLGPGRLVRSPENATIYMIDGTSSKYPISTFLVPESLGLGTSFSFVPASVLDEYDTSTFNLAIRITCDGRNYIGSYGYLYEITENMQSHYQLEYISPSVETCKNLRKSNKALNRFLLSENGTIFQIVSGQKRPISSYPKYLELGGDGSNTHRVSNPAINQIPTGQIIN